MLSMTRISSFKSRSCNIGIVSRTLSTDAAAASSKIVDDLLQYVFNGATSTGNQALDIIKSGLGSQPDAEAGLGSARFDSSHTLAITWQFCLPAAPGLKDKDACKLCYGISGCTLEWQRWRETKAIG